MKPVDFRSTNPEMGKTTNALISSCEIFFSTGFEKRHENSVLRHTEMKTSADRRLVSSSAGCDRVFSRISGFGKVCEFISESESDRPNCLAEHDRVSPSISRTIFSDKTRSDLARSRLAGRSRVASSMSVSRNWVSMLDSQSDLARTRFAGQHRVSSLTSLETLWYHRSCHELCKNIGFTNRCLHLLTRTRPSRSEVYGNVRSRSIEQVSPVTRVLRKFIAGFPLESSFFAAICNGKRSSGPSGRASSDVAICRRPTWVPTEPSRAEPGWARPGARRSGNALPYVNLQTLDGSSVATRHLASFREQF